MISALILAVVTIVLSAAYSGLETGIYRLSRLRLHLGAEKGKLRHILLSRVMRDGSALLSGERVDRSGYWSWTMRSVFCKPLLNASRYVNSM